MPLFRRGEAQNKDTERGFGLRRTMSIVAQGPQTHKIFGKPFPSEVEVSHQPNVLALQRARAGTTHLKSMSIYRSNKLKCESAEALSARTTTTTPDVALGLPADGENGSDKTMGRTLNAKRSIFHRLGKTVDEIPERRPNSINTGRLSPRDNRDELSDTDFEKKLARMNSSAAGYANQRAFALTRNGVKRTPRSARIGLGIELEGDAKLSEDIRPSSVRSKPDVLNLDAFLTVTGHRQASKTADAKQSERQSFLRLPMGLRSMPFMDDDTFASLNSNSNTNDDKSNPPSSAKEAHDLSEAASDSDAKPAPHDTLKGASKGGDGRSAMDRGQGTQTGRPPLSPQVSEASQSQRAQKQRASPTATETAQRTDHKLHDEGPQAAPSFPHAQSGLQAKNLASRTATASRRGDGKDRAATMCPDGKLRRQLQLYNSQVRRACNIVCDAVIPSSNLSGETKLPFELQRLGIDADLKPEDCKEHLRALLLHIAHRHLLCETQQLLDVAGLQADESVTICQVQRVVVEHAPMSMALANCALQLKLRLTALKASPSRYGHQCCQTMTQLHGHIDRLLRFAGLCEGGAGVKVADGHKQLRRARDNLEVTCALARGVHLGEDVTIDEAVLDRGRYEITLASSGPATVSADWGCRGAVNEGDEVSASPRSPLTQQLGLVVLALPELCAGTEGPKCQEHTFKRVLSDSAGRCEVLVSAGAFELSNRTKSGRATESKGAPSRQDGCQ